VALSHKEAMKRKQEDIDDLKKKFDDSKIAIFTDYRGGGKGMTVKSITDLRSRLRETESEYKVYKNSLCRLVVKEKGAEELTDVFKNPTAIVFGFKDPASTSKVVVDFLKEQRDNQLPQVKAAYMDGVMFKPDQLEVLATLPTRDELLAMVLRAMNGPLQGFVNVLSGVPRSFVTVLDRIREEKEKQVQG
jgi:large subunit ribosomal protein L10